MKLNVLPHGAYRPLDTPEYEAEFSKRKLNADTGEYSLETSIKNSQNPLRTVIWYLSKTQKISKKTTALNDLAQVYKNAIVLTNPKEMIGVMMAFLPAIIIPAFMFGGFALPEIINDLIEFRGGIIVQAMNLFYLIPVFLGVFFSLNGILFSIRFTLFNYLDSPVVFDRKHRKVYRVFRKTPTLVEYIKHVFKNVFTIFLR